MTVQGEGQGEALLLSQVGKQNPMFAVPAWPWSGSCEAGWGEARVSEVDGVCVGGASPLPPIPTPVLPDPPRGPAPPLLPACYLLSCTISQGHMWKASHLPVVSPIFLELLVYL